ncbi:hypothetical protein ACFV9C_18215 [Kribbella sp. NPDC059898]|uniref:hypothetical protein n=1 Tax=Kribbella sp. NPDC059898 TaxID=3346995 RepID=UPI00365A9F8B
MTRTPPEREAERKLTGTELITESGLRRNVIYEHRDLIDEFKVGVKAQNTTPLAMQQLADEHATAKKELAKLKETTGQRTSNQLRPPPSRHRTLAGAGTGDDRALHSKPSRSPAAPFTPVSVNAGELRAYLRS